MTEIRPANATDAEDMADVQNAIYRAGLRSSPVNVALVRERYLDMEYNTVACTVAEQEDQVLGFQSLKWAWPGNPYDVPEGWGIIGVDNAPALAYYSAIGFTPYREGIDVIPHRFDV